MHTIVAIVDWNWVGDSKKPTSEQPSRYQDIHVKSKLDAKSVEHFCTEVREKTGWEPIILGIMSLRTTGPLPGDTRRLPCSACGKDTLHQFVRRAILPDFNIGYDYLWECLTCEKPHQSVL